MLELAAMKCTGVGKLLLSYYNYYHYYIRLIYYICIIYNIISLSILSLILLSVIIIITDQLSPVGIKLPTSTAEQMPAQAVWACWLLQQYQARQSFLYPTLVCTLALAVCRTCRYENIVQIRCLYEGVTVQDMLDNWHDMLPAKMKEWGLDRQKVSSCQLVEHPLFLIQGFAYSC